MSHNFKNQVGDEFEQVDPYCKPCYILVTYLQVVYFDHITLITWTQIKTLAL